MEAMEEGEEHQGQEAHEEHGARGPVVYLQAFQWGYNPGHLCLKAGVPYEFRMMAADVTHGASIQLGQGSTMVRLPPAVEVREVVVFTQPGEYLLYCSYYCGLGHQMMKGTITVEPGPPEHKEGMPGPGEGHHHEEGQKADHTH